MKGIEPGPRCIFTPVALGWWEWEFEVPFKKHLWESGAAYPMIGAPIHRFQSYADCKRFQADFAARGREDAVRWLSEESKKAAAREVAKLAETDAWCKPVVWGREAFGPLQWNQTSALRVRSIGGPAAEGRLRAWVGKATKDAEGK